MGIFPESLPVFFGLSVILFGGAAFMMGQAIADTWRPAWQNLPYGLLMAAGCRFLTFGLFDAPLLSVGGYFASVVVILALAFVAWRMARARRMVAQYPWLYETNGLFGWKEKSGAA